MKRRPPPRDRRRPLMEELEPRLLLSAEVDPELVDPGRDGGDPPAQVALLAEQEAPVVSAVAALRKEIVFVDGGTEGYEDLVADLQSQPARGRVLEVVVLDPELDGVAQITEALDDREELDAVHIVSHGTQGAVQLGSTVLSGESLGRFESAIASWADAMDEHGDLLFYGCDLAGGDVGAAFVESIAKLTGADVAASLDLTGSDLLGGDWELEHHEGRIESTLAFSAELRATWVGVLDVASFQEGVAGYASTLDTELDSAAPDADNSNVARIDVDSGPTKQGLVQFENIFGSGPDQIPFGSTINSATVTFDVTDGTVPTATVAMHRLLVDWDESATWNSMGGGIQLDDSEATATADSVLADPVSTGAQTFTGLEATLQAWSDGAANHGWVLVSDDSDFWKFSSSDNGTVANNPLLTVDFTPPNAAPVLTPAAPSLPGISEDDAGNAGQDVATLLGASVSDADAGALEGIAVTATSVTGGGAWQFSIDGGSTWSGVGAVSDGSALVLRDTDRIRFQPDGQNGASASFDFRAWDRTDASTEGTRVDASTTGGSTAFSAASDTASITVGAVNDAPTVHAWYDTSWDYRKAVTIDASLADADLTDFPVLVSLSADADLAALAQADGDDILFTTADGTKLAHEIENFDAATGALTVWVKTDVSSLNDTTLFLYYGNAAASDQQDAANVWDSHFMGVWHLGDTPTGAPGDVRDSTIHANHGTTEGAMDAADSVVARVGRGLDFDETNDLIRVQDSATLDSVADEATFEVWVWFDDASDGNHQIIMTSSNRFSATDGYEWASQGSGDHFFYPDAMTPDGNFNLGPNPFTDQQWHHLAATLDFATKEVEIYVDGTPMTFTSEGVPGMWTTLTSSDDWLWGGNPDRASRYFDGMMDEIRVSDVVRSEEWIRASAANQSNPSAYLTLGAAESRGLALTPVQEDDTDPAGDDVSTILASGAGDRVTDVDTGALEGIAVVAVDDTNGTWEYTTDGGGSWLAFGSPSTNTARLLAQDANTAIRFVPDADWNGTVSDGITFHAWDQSSGANGGTADLGALGTGGTTAFSAATESASMTVVPYSALPVATDDSLTTAQDTPLVIDVATDLLANDSDPEGDALTLLDFTNPANGSVVDNGDGTLTYTPDPGYTGADSFDYVATDANQGTVHYWKLDGDGNDAVGTSHGTVTGTTAVAGHYGSALSFDEVDDRVVVPDFTYNNSFTISFRFKIDDNTGNDYQYLYSHGNVSSLEAVNIFLGEDGNTNAGMLRTKLADGNDTDDDATLSAALEVDISSLIGDGQWHTYTLTVASGTGSAVYIDGVLGNSSSYGGDAFDPGTNLHLGTREDLDPDRFYGGVLDSVQVFDRALDATQVSDLHSGGSARGTVDITVGAANTAPTATDDPGAHGALVSSLSPLSHWRLGESAGPAAADLGSAANDGTYQGVTLGQPGALNGDADTAARFDGAEYVEFAHSADYMIDEGALQFWFNADSTGSNQSLFSKDALGNTDGGHFSITYRADGSLEWRLQSASADYFATSAPVSAGAWHHVVASFGPSGMELYVDGVLAGSDAYTGGLGTSSGGSGNAEPFVIGASTQTSGSGVVTPVADFFTGWMDEVAIFGSQLTAEQAQDLHASGLQHYTIAEDSTLVVSAQEGVLANDFDGDGDALTAVLVAGPSSAASFSLNPDGSFDYTPTANFSGTDTFTYRADDGSDTSNIATVTITVTAVADAPVLTPTAPMLTPISEDDAGNGGDPVSSLVSGSDADGDTLGIAITATSVTGGGAWEFSTDGGSTWTAFGAVADGSALLLRDTDLVRFEPDGQNGATGSFDFRAWDQTSGTAGTKVDASTTGGTSAFSAASDTASIVVSDVNDAPVLAPLGPSLTPIGENDIGNAGDDVASILGLSVSDVDAVAVEGIAITATNVTGGGAWEFSTDGGGTWTAVGAVADGSALLLRATDLVRFQPDGQNGATGSFDFRAWDQTSGSAGAKVDTTTNGADTAFSTASDSASIAVGDVNDAPVLTPTAPALTPISEDDVGNAGQAVSTVLTSSDVDAGAVAGIAITGTSIAGGGSWEYSTDGGGTWSAVGAVTEPTALLLRSTDLVRFQPDGQNGATGSFDFRAWDRSVGSAGATGNASLNGGSEAFSAGSDTASIVVGSLNDAPVLTPTGTAMATLTEDDVGNGGQAVSTLLTSTDVDGGAVEGIAITSTTVAGPGTWQYSTNGGSTWNAVGAVSGGSARLLRSSDLVRFRPDGRNAATASFTFRAWDQTSGAAGGLADASAPGGTSAFSVQSDGVNVAATAVNDAPTLSLPGAQTAPDSQPHRFSSADGNAITVGDVDAGASVQVTLSASDGTVSLGSTAGVTVTVGSGTDDVTVTFVGNVASVNAALDGTTFSPTGSTATSLAVSVDDLGNTGAGVPLQASGSIDLGFPASGIDPGPEPEDEPTPDPPPVESVEDLDPDPEPEVEAEPPETEPPVAQTGFPGIPGGGEEIAAPPPAPTSNQAIPVAAEIVDEAQDDDDDRRPAQKLKQRDIFWLRGAAQLEEALAELGNRMREDAEAANSELDRLVFSLERVTLALSAGFLTIALRSGSLFALALSSLPLWRRVDPLAVLALSEEERRQREAEMHAAEAEEQLGGAARILDAASRSEAEED